MWMRPIGLAVACLAAQLAGEEGDAALLRAQALEREPVAGLERLALELAQLSPSWSCLICA